MIRIFYYLLIISVFHILVHAQGVGFPGEPAQAPISGLAILLATGIGLSYKKLKNKDYE